MQNFIKLNQITEIEETRKIFNEIRNKFSKSVIEKFRKKLYKKEKGLENNEEQERRQHTEELKTFKIFLKGLLEEIKKTITNQ